MSLCFSLTSKENTHDSIKEKDLEHVTFNTQTENNTRIKYENLKKPKLIHLNKNPKPLKTKKYLKSPKTLYLQSSF